jgi:hypothetical protein
LVVLLLKTLAARPSFAVFCNYQDLFVFRKGLPSPARLIICVPMIEAPRVSESLATTLFRLPVVTALLLFVAFLAGRFVSAAEPSARVAVIGQDQPEMAALLTARLGREPGVQLLEREEIQKIVKEQEVPKNGVEDAHTLGKLLGADYIVFLEGVSAAGGGAIQARLVWSEPGAVLASINPPEKMPADQAADWLAERIIPHLHKVTLKDIRRISLLGLRCVTDSAENQLLERELNAALSARLEADPGFVVLERWHMDDLVFEKSVNNITDSPFWLAADVVDGAIAPSQDKLEVHIRIREPVDSSTTDAQCEGSRRDLTSLAESIARQLTKNPRATSRVRDGKNEAEAFYHEGEWLFAQGLPEDAAGAFESAWALGRHDDHTASMRVRAYAQCAWPDGRTTFFLGDHGYRQGSISGEEMPRRIAIASQTLYLAGDYMDKHGATRPLYPEVDIARSPEVNMSYGIEDPVTVGITTLYTGLRVLRAAYEAGFHIQDPPAVAELRQAIRDNIGRLNTLSPGRPKMTFLNHLIDYAAYWSDTPAEAIGFYRKVLGTTDKTAGPAWPVKVRGEFGNVVVHPPLIDWSNSDQTKAQQAWREYVEQLAHSNNPLEHTDGLALQFPFLPNRELRNALFQDMLDFLVKAPGWEATADAPAIFADLHEALNRGYGVHLSPLACESSIDICVRMLQIHQPRPEVLGLIPLIADGRSILTRDDAARLLAAVQGHAAALPPPIDKVYADSIEQAKRDVCKRFPDLLPAPVLTDRPNTFHVTRLWTAAKYLPGARIDSESAVWEDGCLMFGPLSEKGELTAIHLPDFQSKTTIPTASRGFAASRLVVLPDRFYRASEHSICEMDRGSSLWRNLDLPDRSYLIALRDGALWAAYGGREGESGLYRIDVKTNQTKLIFSTRRRPIEHPLDDSGIIAPYCLLPTGDGWPVIGSVPYALIPPKDGQPIFGNHAYANGFFYTETGAPWTNLPFPTFTAFSRDYDGGVLVCQTVATYLLCGIGRVTDQGHFDCLAWDPKRSPPAQGAPIWNFPAGCGVGGAYVTKHLSPSMLGDELFLLMRDTEGYSRYGAPVTTLYCFRSGRKDPIAIPLVFDLQDQDRKYAGTGETYPMAGPSGLLATPDGLVITGCPTGSAFWFIPKADLENAISAADKVSGLEKNVADR